MKSLLLFGLILLTSCGTGLSSRPRVDDTPSPLAIKTYLDNFLANNPSCMNNTITRQDGAMILREDLIVALLGDSIQCITELPGKFEMALGYPGEDKYVVKFGFSEYVKDFEVSDDYKLMFQTFSIVDKATASRLITGQRYRISGQCYDFANHSSFMLPSGNYTEDYPSITVSASDAWGNTKPVFNLGTFIIEGLQFEPIE